jgi:hypothetical protein
MGDVSDACEILVGKPGGKTQLRKPNRRWKDNINMALREVGCVDGIYLTQDRTGTVLWTR